MSSDLQTPAVLHFEDGDYTVIRPGRFVRCAVTDRPIPLEALRYWSAVRQEAYAGAAEAQSRMAPGRDAA